MTIQPDTCLKSNSAALINELANQLLNTVTNLHNLAPSQRQARTQVTTKPTSSALLHAKNGPNLKQRRGHWATSLYEGMLNKDPGSHRLP